jgi:L-rhamnonate dehydratase
MKIISIECLKRVSRPIGNPTKPRRPVDAAAGGVPYPIHIYREFSRTDRKAVPGGPGGEMWVRITAEDGTYGLGHCNWGDLAAPVVRTLFAGLLAGRNCLAIEFLNDLMWRSTQRLGGTGIVSSAQSAVDVALWDLKGKLYKAPVYEIIGGPCRSEIDCYVTATDLDWAMELGFRAFKINNTAHHSDGTDGINKLEATVAAAREKVGPAADLMLNAVMSFNVDYAARVMERLAPYDLRWFEEPLPPNDTKGLMALKRAVPAMPLATGEDHRGRHMFRDIIEARCVDVLQPDIRWTGGLTETLKIYNMGEAAGLQTIAHSGGNMPAGQHLSAAMPEVRMAEYLMLSAPGVPLEEVNPVPGMPVPVNGKLVLSDAAGFGMEFRSEDFVPFP